MNTEEKSKYDIKGTRVTVVKVLQTVGNLCNEDLTSRIYTYQPCDRVDRSRRDSRHNSAACSLDSPAEDGLVQLWLPR